MLRSIIIFLSLKQLFRCAIFSTESINKLRLLVKHNTLELSVSPFSVELFHNIREFGKNILQTIELLIQFSHLLLQREIFLGYSFTEKVAVKGNSPETTC